MKRRGKYIGCSIQQHNGRLRLRFRWEGKYHGRSTKLTDTPENRKKLEPLACLVGATIAAGKNPLTLFEAPDTHDVTPKAVTVKDYFDEWITDQVPPLVRKALARDYRSHIAGYVLPQLGPMAIADLSAREIIGLRAELLERGLSLKYVKNILVGSFKAMLRDARQIGQHLTHNPFDGIRWPRVPIPPPDPFEATERTRILWWFEAKRFGFHSGRAADGDRFRPHPQFHAFVHTLFWTGMRPSEAAGLKWGDVNLELGILRIVRSRYLREDNATKTPQAQRTVQLLEETVRVLLTMKPPDATPDDYVFTNTEGRPIEPKRFDHWHACLKSLGIRVRGLYSTKDTYVSTALTAGVNPTWLEEQTGVRYDTLKRHYGKWLRRGGADQLEKIAQLDPKLDPEGAEGLETPDAVDENKCRGRGSNPYGGNPHRILSPLMIMVTS